MKHKGMKHKLASLGRAVLGRHAYRVGLDAPPFEHAVKPIFMMQKRLQQMHRHHSAIAAKNSERVLRIMEANRERDREAERADRYLKKLYTFFG